MRQTVRRGVFFSLVTFLIILISASFVLAGEKGLKEGAWSLQFEIDRDFQPTSFKGSMLSIKHHSKATSAWRLGLKLDVDISDGETSTESTDTIYDNSWDGVRNNKRFTIDLVYQFMKYINTKSDFNIFVGYGPRFGYNSKSDYRETARFYADDLVVYSYDNSSHNIYFGGEVSLGVEWFFSKNASLLAEYGAQLSYFRSYSKSIRRDVREIEIRRDVNETEADNLEFRSNPVKFGLSIYF